MPLSLARAYTLSRSAFKTTAAVASVLALCTGVASAQSTAPQNNTAPHLPDMTAYNCATATVNTAAATRHIGQVIKGRYHEWYEFHVQANGQPHLGCISLVRPTARQLSADEAKTFLTNSFAVGAPAASTNEHETNQSLQDAEPANVQAEPLKRVRPPSASSSTEQKATTSDQPPAPASKNFDDPAVTAPAVIKPSKERSGAIEDSPDAALETPATVGVEDRFPITNTITYPWTTLAYLSVTYPNGDSFRCSSTLVSPYVVVTAGHCVHNNTRGGYIVSARVYPGQRQFNQGDNPSRPFGMKTDVAQVQTTSQWTQISGEDSYPITQYRHDFAAIQFKTAFTHTSTFMPVLYSSTLSPVTNAGYPAEFNNASAMGLYTDSGNETSLSLNSLRSSHVREFAIDASPGNSGGPFIYLDTSTNQYYLVGSLSYGEDQDDQSGGPWYDSWNQSLVSSWVAWTPTSATAATVSGLRVSSVFSSVVPNATSYLRFYNAGTASGTVDITLADYATGNVLATWTSGSIAGHRTRQYAISEIEAAANATFTKPAIYSLSVRPTFTGSFQNTLWNSGSASLVNASTCDTQATDQKSLIYVHSSMLSPYTSTIVVHNTGTTGVSPTLGIYNAETGARLTGYTTNVIPPNGQAVLEIATLEKAANITSTTSFHYNIVAESNFTGYMQQFLNNQSAKVIADMTTACAMSP